MSTTTPGDAASGAGSSGERFLAELARAMRGTAQAACDEALERHLAETDALLERLRAAGAELESERRAAAAAERSAVDSWVAAETARIRQEAEARLADHEARLERSLADEAVQLAARTATVARISDGYRDELAAFQERLLATDDPSRFAELALAIPEAPSYAGLDLAWPPVVAADGPMGGGIATGHAPAPAPAPEAPAPSVETTGAHQTPVGPPEAHEAPRPEPDRHAALSAAEAEVAAHTGHLPHGGPDGRDAHPLPELPEVGTTRIVVTGLISLAGVSTFKQQLARRPGIQSLSVSSSADGAFVFTVVHRTSLALLPIVEGLETFAPRVSAGAGDELHVLAVDPEAA